MVIAFSAFIVIYMDVQLKTHQYECQYAYEYAYNARQYTDEYAYNACQCT